MARSKDVIDERPEDQDLPDDSGPLAFRWSVGRALAVLTMLVIVGFWAWIFSGAPARKNPDFLDRAYAEKLGAQCQAMVDNIATLPSGLTITDATERADVLDQANEMIAEFIEEVRQGAPSTGNDAKSITGWLGDWETYLANREDYANRLREDPSARLLLDASPLGDAVDRTILVFAEINHLDACQTPGDIG
ncbi:MAG: hypothetical protein KDA95_07305 [Acidimicrobiales bacterium]|nr:hypothetical protein [Acidimicrobiales bacterium]